MPRTKQSPRKNLRDIPNPTNWASNLRNIHRKYLYLIYAFGCDRMVVSCGRTGTFCGWMVLSHYNLSTHVLCSMLLLYSTLQSDAIGWLHIAVGWLHPAVRRLVFALRYRSTLYLLISHFLFVLIQLLTIFIWFCMATSTSSKHLHR